MVMWCLLRKVHIARPNGFRCAPAFFNGDVVLSFSPHLSENLVFYFKTTNSVKKLILLALGSLSLLTASQAQWPLSQTSLLSLEAHPPKNDDFKQALLALIKGWKDPATNADASATWVPEFGIRGKYFSNKNLLSIGSIVGLIGEPIFLLGPHNPDMNFKSGSFGQYNPKFLKKLNKELKAVLADKDFVAKAKPLYDQYLLRYLRMFATAHQEALGNKKDRAAAIAEYEKQIATNPDAAGMAMQEYFRQFADLKEGEGYSWYEANTAAVFWVRRAIDQTDADFLALLKTVMKTFDPQFKAK
jgi:hypothetical protein